MKSRNPHRTTRLYGDALGLQKRNVFVDGRAAEIAHTGKLADIEMAGLIGGIVAEEDCRNIIFRYLRPPDLLALGFCVCHARPYTLPYHG